MHFKRQSAKSSITGFVSCKACSHLLFCERGSVVRVRSLEFVSQETANHRGMHLNSASRLKELEGGEFEVGFWNATRHGAKAELTHSLFSLVCLRYCDVFPFRKSQVYLYLEFPNFECSRTDNSPTNS